jgi:ferritin
MPGIAIKKTVLAEIQRQLNHELGASQGYLAMALWCDLQNYKGFARFFFKQVDEERAHARKFMSHLLDRGALPEIGEVAAPKGRFDSMLDLVEQAQQMERKNTEGIHKAFEAAVAAKDYPAQVLLQWFINEQVEEEAWADELVDRVTRATCPGGLAELDRHVESYLEGSKG